MGATRERRLLLATNNPGKAKELRVLLADSGWVLVTPAEIGLQLDVAEHGGSYAANARLKASAFARAAGMPAVADDSGIEVDALEGAPGIESARYGGDGLSPREQVDLLLRALEGIPERRRTARFRCLMAVAGLDGPQTFEGAVEGVIAPAPAGGGGFGYDPVFRPNGYDVTMAELSPEEKDRISHRGRAARLAAAALREVRG